MVCSASIFRSRTVREKVAEQWHESPSHTALTVVSNMLTAVTRVHVLQACTEDSRTMQRDTFTDVHKANGVRKGASLLLHQSRRTNHLFRP